MIFLPINFQNDEFLEWGNPYFKKGESRIVKELLEVIVGFDKRMLSSKVSCGSCKSNTTTQIFMLKNKRRKNVKGNSSTHAIQ
jgi:hypothetical protein